MKKLTLFLVAMLFSTLSFAALNPFAYGLESQLSDDKGTVTLTYSLNADATSVNIVILDGETVLKTVACDGKTAKGTHSLDVLTNGFPEGKTLSWKVEVKGAAVTSVAIHDVKYNAYHPSGIDIDNNPESPHFGRILCTEAMHSVQGKTRTDGKTGTNGTNYLGTTLGAGIYEFDPAFTFVKGYNGVKTFVTTSNHYAPRRIRISKDGRIFATAQDNSGEYLWEINPDNLDSWTSVFQGTNSDFTLKDGSGKFIAGTNSGFDVRGTGENLQLLMLSANKPGAQVATFKLHEYNLGDATSWSTVPTRELSGCQLHSSMITNQSQVQYDNEGGYWITYWVNTTNSNNYGGIAHFKKDGASDFIKQKINLRNAGFRFNHDFTKVIIATNDVTGASKIYKQATVYAVSKDANGVPVLTKETTIDMTTVGNNLNDFAWDYADNIYVVGNSSEYVAVYPYTHAADKVVSTPCRADEAIVIPAPAQLNPFAYNLWSELSADEKNLTIKYSLNAKATSVEWVLMDGNNVVKTIDLASLGLEKGDYTTTISTTDFPQYKQLTWKIEVKGVAVSEPTEYPVSYDFYHPSSVDIDNNPENPTFGLILCNEAMQSVKGKKQTDTGEDYLSSSLGAGIYAFNPAFENTGKYNGGNEFTTTRADGTGTAYSPRRIRISDDGRIFVTSLNTDGNYLWEVNPKNMNEWTTVFKGTLNANKELVDASSNFVAAPNVGFDVRGEGADLKLLMLSSNLRGFPSTYAVSAFKCHEYNLGTATTWNSAPSKTILSGKYMINYTGDQVAYDAEGGVWFCQHQGTAKEDYPSLVHINKNGVEDYKEVVNNRMAGGIRFNADFSKVIIAGIEDGTKNSKKATLYKVSKDASGKPILTPELVIDMATLGNNLNDFAWDYAGNLYGVSNSSEKIAVWAMPHSSEDAVATPAASKYAFSIGKYTVTVNTNDENKGTVSGAGEYKLGETTTLTATPKPGYKLLYWSDRSTENPRNITVDGNEALSAYFIKKNDVEPTFSITKVWENTNVPASTNNGYQGAGWDGKIYVKDRLNNKILVYSETGSSPYVEFGGSYEGLAGDQAITMDDAGNMIIRSGSTFFYDAPSQISIFKKGETTPTVIDFTLPASERCDFISASGNIFSAEGGYVYFYCKNTTCVNRLKITNGAATTSDVSIDVIGNITAEIKDNTQSHVMVDIFGNLVTHARTFPITTTINAHTGESMNFTLPNNHKANALGGCSFELAGKEFWAFNVKGTNTCNSEWNLYNLTDGAFVSSDILYAKNTTDKNSAANWLNVQVVDEKTAYIYQFCPTVGAAVWKVSVEPEYTYELNGGVTNDYGWMSKDDMFKACMNDGGVTTLPSLTELKALGNDAALTAICGKFGKVAAQKVLDNDKWNWLEEYVMSVQNASSATKLVAGGDPTDNTGWAYAIAAFFIEGQRTTWPVSANFAQAGLDEAYQRAWKHGYDNPTKPTSEFVLNTPYKEDYTFDGWYTTSDFSGEKVTTIQKPTTDITLYAKWIEYIPTIAEVKALADNATTNVAGVVTYISGNEVFVQDPTGGIVIVTATNATCTIGQSIKASGTKTITNGAPQVINATIASAEAGTLPEETAFESLNQLVNDTDLKHYATRITVPGLKVASYDSNGYPTLTDGLNTALCYKMPINQSTFPVGTKVVITAVGGWNNGFQFRGDVAGVTLAPGIAKDTYAYPARENGKYTLANKWIVSNIKGNYQANKPGPDGYVRAMAAANGKMYFINRETESLTVVDGATGAMLNSIAITGTDIFKVGGNLAVTVAYNDIKVDDAGNILISACVSSGNTFFVYKVNPTTGVATELIKDRLQDTWSGLNYRFDAIGVAGDVTNDGIIMAANANAWEAYRWKINDGVVGTCEKITLTGTGSNPGTAPQIQPLDAQGKQFYVDGSGINPILFNEDGTQAGKFTAGATIRNNIDDVAYLNQTLNGITEFTIGADRFAVLAATATNTTPPASYALYKFTDDSHNISTAEPLWFFPNNGMGTVTNGSFAAPVSVEVNEQIATIYLYSANNGYAAYTFTVNQVTISDDADNTTALVDYEGKTVTAVVKRNFTANNYMTLTLPFDMSAPQITQVFGNGAKVYELAKVVEGATEIHLQFRPTSVIVAGTPYILDIDADVNGFIIDNVVIDTELRPVNPEGGAITMVPVLDYDGSELNQATQYWLASDNYLYSAGAYPTDLLGLRAYFQSTSPLPVRARVVYNDNETTGLPTIEQPANNVRKIFKDGQIIIIRGEQQYNIQGQRMQ